MPELNSDRALAKIVCEVCAARGLELASFSDDWVFQLRKGQRSARIFGYDFDLNTAAAKMIAKDKSATSDLLGANGIPRVEHRLFHGPQLAGYVPMEGNWRSMLDFFERCRKDVVCKPNEGTCGRGVLRARKEAELESAVHKLFSQSRSISLSPYEAFNAEYRVGVVKGSVEFMYRKDRPQVFGDGRSTVRDLILSRIASAGNVRSHAELINGLAENQVDESLIPAAGEVVILNWRHNLGQGAQPQMVDPSSSAGGRLAKLATESLDALGVTVASADIVELNGTLKVLEVNSGIMMENLVRSVPDGWNIAKRFYDKIICAMFDIPFA